MKTSLLAAFIRSPPRERREGSGIGVGPIPPLTRRATQGSGILLLALSVTWVVGPLATAAPGSAAETHAPTVLVGHAKSDITPELPIWLAGYQSRPGETKETQGRLYARALAIGSDAQKPAVLLTVEVVGIAESMSDAVAAALGQSHRIQRARVAVCATHVHTGPALHGVLPYMFSKDLPPAEATRIERYTAALQGKLIEVARAALADRRPARLAWGEGTAAFAEQRRIVVPGKPVTFGHDPNGQADRALPVLRVTDERGAVRAIFLSYACHCTTLTGKENFVHPDWAGDAALRIEAAHAGALALVAIGCGADANPEPRGSLEHVVTHGRAIAAEVARILGGTLRPLGPLTAASYRRIELDLDHAVTREELQGRLAGTPRQQVSYAAKKFLERLDAGQPAPTRVPYPVQIWAFGGELAMVFLAGEVVSEYSLRLRRELAAGRLWVNAYANSVPCYIASKAMFPEGGYEVDGSMDYYGLPTRLAIGTEDRIIGTVREMVAPAFKRPDPK